MHREFDYTVAGFTYRGVAEQADRPWGKGVDIKIIDTEGEVRDSISFVCHPEFDGYDEVQRKTPEALVEMAVDLLNSRKYEADLKKLRQHKMTLFCRLNDGKWNGPYTRMRGG